MRENWDSYETHADGAEHFLSKSGRRIRRNMPGQTEVSYQDGAAPSMQCAEPSTGTHLRKPCLQTTSMLNKRPA